MAEGDRTDDMPPGGPDKPRRRPPVIELEATEVGEDGAKTAKPKPEPALASKPEQPESKKQNPAGMNLTPYLPAAIAGGIGALAGAAIVYFAVPQMNQSGSAPDAALVREVASLNARIEALSKQPSSSPETAVLGQRIDKLTAAIAEAEKRLAATEQKTESPMPALAPAQGQTDPAVESASKELREALADLRKLARQTEQQPALSSAIESLSARIAALDSRVTSLAAAGKTSASSELAREIVALNALAAAIQSGKAFAQELGAVRAISGRRATALDFLEPSAAKGLPTVANLAAQFSVLAPQLLQKKETSGGFLDRLYSNATNLVEVRRIGEPQGDEPGAVVTRIEAMLMRGDLAGALQETAKLPEAAKAQAAPWITEANRRRAAEVAVRKLLDDALVAPEQPKS
jgi:hypothetical protein